MVCLPASAPAPDGRKLESHADHREGLPEGYSRHEVTALFPEIGRSGSVRQDSIEKGSKKLSAAGSITKVNWQAKDKYRGPSLRSG